MSYILLDKDLLKPLGSFPCDIFINLPLNNKYLKIFNKDQEMLDFDKIHNKDLNFFYKEEDRSLLIRNYKKNIKTSIINEELPNADIELYTSYIKGFEFILENLDFKEKESSELDDYLNIKNAFENIVIENSINGKIISDKRNMLNLKLTTNNSLKKCILCLMLYRKLALLKENAIANIISITFFADIAPHNELDQLSHIKESLAFIQSFKRQFSPDVNLGILDHHEYFDGSGLMKKSGSKIHPLAHIYRIVDDYITSPQLFQKNKKTSKYNPDYASTFTMIIDSLRNIEQVDQVKLL